MILKSLNFEEAEKIIADIKKNEEWCYYIMRPNKTTQEILFWKKGNVIKYSILFGMTSSQGVSLMSHFISLIRKKKLVNCPA